MDGRTGRARKSFKALLEIRYTADGFLEWQWSEPDTRKKKQGKFRRHSNGVESQTPAWKDLHKLQYGHLHGLPPMPGPVNALLAMMAYDVHCMGIRETRRKNAQKKAGKA